MAKVYVSDIKPNDRVESVFKVFKKALPTGKSGKPYMTLTLTDKSGEIDARIWENAAELDKAFGAGDLVKVTASTVVHQGHPQLKVDAIEKTSLGELPADDFTEPPPSAEPVREVHHGGGNIERRFAEVVGLIERVNDPHVRALLQSFVEDEELAPLIKRAPAAKTIHHAHTGGLLEHTLSCMRLAHRLADHYPMVDRDLLLAGAFLHDVMKVKELAFERGTEYSDQGRLVGHLVMTAQEIHDRAQKIDGFPQQLEWHLVHIALSHHGSLEYGSPKVPATLEALLVHELDEIDSRVNSWLQIMQRDPGENWTSFDKLYERHLWKGPAPTANGKRPVESRGGGKKRHKVPPAASSEGEREPSAARAERPHREGRERDAAPRPERPPRGERAERPPREPREPRPPKGEVKLTFKPFAAIAPAEAQPEAAPEPPAESAQPAQPEAAPEAPANGENTPS